MMAAEIIVLCVRAMLIDVMAMWSWFLGDSTWLLIVAFV
jgi:hypothetical protein